MIGDMLARIWTDVAIADVNLTYADGALERIRKAIIGGAVLTEDRKDALMTVMRRASTVRGCAEDVEEALDALARQLEQQRVKEVENGA